jgi:hypothetical protein
MMIEMRFVRAATFVFQMFIEIFCMAALSPHYLSQSRLNILHLIC